MLIVDVDPAGLGESKVVPIWAHREQNTRQIPGRLIVRHHAIQLECLAQWMVRDITKIAFDTACRILNCQSNLVPAHDDRSWPISKHLPGGLYVLHDIELPITPA